MRRSVLLTLAALGGLVSLIGGVGLFAALTDSARTGTNSAESGALAASADIQLATASTVSGGVGLVCGEFSENLTTGFFTSVGLKPGDNVPMVFFCIKNAGSQPVTLRVGVDELSDIEIGCTGDEAEFDPTCGNMAPGELSDALNASFDSYPLGSPLAVPPITCDDPNASNTGQNLRVLGQTSIPIGFFGGVHGAPLPAGQTGCFGVRLFWHAQAAESQQSQSDRVTWRFRFDAQA